MKNSKAFHLWLFLKKPDNNGSFISTLYIIVNNFFFSLKKTIYNWIKEIILLVFKILLTLLLNKHFTLIWKDILFAVLCEYYFLSGYLTCFEIPSNLINHKCFRLYMKSDFLTCTVQQDINQTFLVFRNKEIIINK